jgi:uncharacterized PurR-regulated membrane protein YhhQ (DUF165 family)
VAVARLRRETAACSSGCASGWILSWPSEGVDSALFVVIASMFGVFPWETALSIIVANYIFKVGIEVLFTPITYRIVSALKKAEQEDYYDVNTDFNPFRIAA